jgi:fructokinase
VITVVGEALIDVVHRPGGANAAYPGGSPANVAVALARLGVPTSLITRLGQDEYGALVRAHLVDNGVELLGSVHDDNPTSVAEATLDEHGVATYFFRLTWDLGDAEPALADGSVCLHTGSLGTVLEPGNTAVRRMLAHAKGSVTLSYDPNCRPALMGKAEDAREGVEELVALVDVVKVSEEDLEWLYAGESYADCARRWLELGPALIVVTLGGNGALGVTKSGTVTRPGVPVKVVDTVGAGDSFTAGLLDGLRRRDLLGAGARDRLAALGTGELGAVLDEASLVASITVGRAGADPPTRAELDAASG